jgi:predicted ribosome quality control (RQC) complex YloA/Tae2 family protein
MYDGLTLGSYLASWRPFLEGARVVDVVHLDALDSRLNRRLEKELRDDRVLALTLAGEGGLRELVFALPGRRAGLFLWPGQRLRRSKPQSRVRQGDQRFLRGVLAGSRITAANQAGRDRILILDLETTDDLGDPYAYQAFFLLIGRRANLVLVRDGLVFCAWRPGARYDEQPRIPASGCDDVAAYLEARRSGRVKPRRSRSLAGELVFGVDGFSAPAAEELFSRAGVPAETTFDELDESQAQRLIEHGRRLMEEVGEVRFYSAPGLLSAVRFTGLESVPTEPEIEADLVGRLERVQYRRRLVERLKGELERVAGRLEKARRDREAALEKHQDADRIQLAGQLLLARPNVKGRAADEFELPDGSTIELDPTSSWLENAQGLFEQARRFRRAREHADGLEELARSLEDELAELRRIEDPDTPFAELAALYDRYRRSERPRGAGGRKLPAKVGHQRLDDGFELYWGRDGHSNDYVTFQIARPYDLWFHVQQGPGAHVIVKRPERDTVVPGKIIEQAARTALRFSKMRTSTHVPIAYTERRYVRHKKGAAGAVFYEREKVIFLDGEM